MAMGPVFVVQGTILLCAAWPVHDEIHPMLRWFENRIDPFAGKVIVQPPSLLWAFYWYFIGPIWPAFALLVFLDFLAALTEVAMASFVAILIDLMKATEVPAAFISDHASLLI